MANDLDDIGYSFIVDYYDELADLTRNYILKYYESDRTLDMFDPKNRRMFLKRCRADGVCLSDLYIGNSINILSRQLIIVAYGDSSTQAKLGCHAEKTCVIVKPDGFKHAGEIIDAIYRSGFQITKMKSFRISIEVASDFERFHANNPYLRKQFEPLCQGPILVMELMKRDCVKCLLDILGPDDPAKARQENSMLLRARFGKDIVKNALHASLTCASYYQEIEYFFPSSGRSRLSNTAIFQLSTLAVIKPHIVLAGKAGEIIHNIQSCGFEVSAYLMIVLDKRNAEEFLEVYKGVVQEYPGMVTQMCSGPCIVLEVKGDCDVHAKFREFVGPPNPDIAQQIRPMTLRARFGCTQIENAIHCTDLPEDVNLELEFFFNILSA